ncbi:hypothetical protein CANCADRAFT_2236 [Tortispora caseinolytica NRRL Y-17796]|uniref:SPX domain-containing protein n=1 Tax=Tortispora caseinolytica NRRL Y-17796 TaxID=767744 RepID=A0A1E4TFL0_9ASCO|nr:hypothetical protein CANCADRAFT_2236 [Tortispora caseinolytica NRRL Y-17796]
MKYGKAIHARSVPEWWAYDLDYEEVKDLIKEATSPSKPSTVSVDDVFQALKSQLETINMFVQLKSKEIDSRINKCTKIINSVTNPPATEGHSVRAARLDSEIISISQELQKLSRFIGVQLTGFRKLLKKYKKWSKSSELNKKFLPLLEDPKSFARKDLTANFLEVSMLFDALRTPDLKPITSANTSFPRDITFEISALKDPPSGSISFWVHPDHVLEVELILLSNLTLVSSQGIERASTPRTPKSSAHQSRIVYIEDPKKLISVQDRSEPPQIVFPQFNCNSRDKYDADDDEDDAGAEDLRQAEPEPKEAIVFAPVGGIRYSVIAVIPAKQAENMFIPEERQKITQLKDFYEAKLAVDWIASRNISPISAVRTTRTRFHSDTEVNADQAASFASKTWAVLNTNIICEKLNGDDKDCLHNSPLEMTEFPNAVLEIKWTGRKPLWIDEQLTESHLVKRIPEFSLFVHTVAIYYTSALIKSPAWISLVHTDIRQTPSEPKVTYPEVGASQRLKRYKESHKLSRQNSDQCLSESLKVPRSSQDHGDSQGSSLGSVSDHGSALTRDSSRQNQPVVRYWNEFDDPEDGDAFGENAGKFTIPIDDFSDNGFGVVGAANSFTSQVLDTINRLIMWINPKRKGKTHFRDVRWDSSDDYDEESTLFTRSSPDGRYGAVSTDTNSVDEIDPLSNAGVYDSEYQRGYTNGYAPAQRDEMLTFVYGTLFFMSITVLSIVAGIMVGGLETVSETVVVAIGLAFSVVLGFAAMVLFLGRSDTPSWWHQGLVYVVFLTIICFAIGGLALMLP